jgi:CspA family cold shock protein
MNGIVRVIHADKGFGFIKGSDGKDYFFHRSALKNINIDQLQVKQEVIFEDAESDKGPRAEDVFV